MQGWVADMPGLPHGRVEWGVGEPTKKIGSVKLTKLRTDKQVMSAVNLHHIVCGNGEHHFNITRKTFTW